MEMIKTQFGEWLKNSGYNTAELTAKLDKNLDGIISREELNSFIRELSEVSHQHGSMILL